MYALIESGGKQYKVSTGQTIQVDRIPLPEGSQVELNKVLLVADGEKVTTGSPYIDGAKVIGKVVASGRGKKVVVFEYKAKTRYRKKQGHRQWYTKLAIGDIIMAGAGDK